VLAEEKPDLLTSFFFTAWTKIAAASAKEQGGGKSCRQTHGDNVFACFLPLQISAEPKKKRKEEVKPNQEATARRPRCSGRQRWLSGGNCRSQPVESRDQRRRGF